MRTDSTRISETAKKEALSYIEETYGTDYTTPLTQQAKKSDPQSTSKVSKSNGQNT